jgi:hypothetical protein
MRKTVRFEIRPEASRRVVSRKERERERERERESESEREREREKERERASTTDIVLRRLPGYGAQIFFPQRFPGHPR